MNKIVLLAGALAVFVTAQAPSPPLLVSVVEPGNFPVADGLLPVSVIVRNELPLLGAAPGTWMLAGAPVLGASCYRNGLREAPGTDYTLDGNILTSVFWQAGDSLVCDYERRFR